MNSWKPRPLPILIGLLLLAGITGGKFVQTSPTPNVLGATATQELDLTTESKFHEEASTIEKEVPFETKKVEDNQLEVGQEVVVQAGKPGLKTIVTKTMYYEEEKYDETTYEEIVEAPVTEIVAVGTKLVLRQLDTPHGTIKYSQKLSGFWATSYDSTCLGCSTTTATGMKQGYGVVAVDPKVIPLGSKVYVPGYGIGLAGDVGGLIKGKKIDLGYDSLMGQWTARYVDVYILVE